MEPIIECSLCGVELDDAVLEAYDLTTNEIIPEELLCGRCLEENTYQGLLDSLSMYDEPVVWRDHNWDFPY